MNNFIEAPPIAKNFIKTLRKFGYTMETAIADIIDNSIGASAKKLEIIFLPGEKWLSVKDDGKGMTQKELIVAMTPGSSDPDTSRKKGDLGRFGSGLKTASWSQAKVLIVITKKNNRISAAKWDLDLVEKKEKWILELLPKQKIDELYKKYSIELKDDGTIVIWDKIDSIQGSSKLELEKDQDDKIATTVEHIEITYHRFLDAGPKNSVKISFNGNDLKAFDPFFAGNGKTHQELPQQVPAGNEIISLTAFTLPHNKFLTSDEAHQIESHDGLFKNQGFYIYRENRLIMKGGWFGLKRFKEISKLARIMVDVPSSLDSEWVTDVKKSNMSPPPIVKKEMKNLMLKFDQRSKKVITFSGKKSIKSTNSWEVLKLDGKYKFEIKKNNALFSDIKKSLSKEQLIKFKKLILHLEEELPLEAIYPHFAADDIYKDKNEE